MRRPGGAVAPAINPRWVWSSCPWPKRRLLLHGAADFADHDDAFGFRIVIEHLEYVQMGHARHGITTDTDAGGLADACAGELPNRFVGKRAAAETTPILPFL